MSDKKIYRVHNWKEYNQSLAQRGSLMFDQIFQLLVKMKVGGECARARRINEQQFTNNNQQSTRSTDGLFRNKHTVFLEKRSVLSS